MPIVGAIRSTANPQVRHVRSLHKRRVRYRERRYLIEGQRVLDTALRIGGDLASAFFTEEFATSAPGAALVERLAAGEAPVWSVTPAVLEHMADTETPQGILAVAAMPEPERSAAAEATLVVALDNLRDPGNLGTILRTSHATGVGAVLLSVGCVDPYAPKVVRAGMGAHFGVRLYPGLEWPRIADLVRGKQILLADAAGEATPWEVDWRLPTCLVVGSEAHGPGAEARRLADRAVRLPMGAETESLNAAVATAVLLYEAYRQRATG